MNVGENRAGVECAPATAMQPHGTSTKPPAASRPALTPKPAHGAVWRWGRGSGNSGILDSARQDVEVVGAGLNCAP